MFPVEVYKTPEAKARYQQLEKEGALQVVKFSGNGFPEQIRFGKVTPEQLVAAIGLLPGTLVMFRLQESDPLNNAVPQPGDLCTVAVEIRNGQPYLFVQRTNPLP